MDSVPRSQVSNKQHKMDWHRHYLAVDRPAIRVFWLNFLIYAMPFETAILIILALTHSAFYDVLIWVSIFALPPLAIAARETVPTYKDFRAEFLEFSEQYFERTHTEYKQVKVQQVGGQRDISQADDGSFKVGRYRFTHRQRRQLARVLAVGDNITHERLKQVGILTGDIKSHENRELANNIQAELIRLGYAEANGRATQLTVKGYREWLDHPPTPE